MRLEGMDWTKSSAHRVVLEWLRAERSKFEDFRDGPDRTRALALIESGNLDAPVENHERLRYLFFIRRPMWPEIPPDTEWFEVRALTRESFSELHVIRFVGWDDARDANELAAVAARHPIALTKSPAEWNTPILFGHTKAGPFTILEGNKRLIALAGAGASADFSIPVIVGLSPTPCFFHAFDPPGMICQDLWEIPLL